VQVTAVTNELAYYDKAVISYGRKKIFSLLTLYSDSSMTVSQNGEFCPWECFSV